MKGAFLAIAVLAGTLSAVRTAKALAPEAEADEWFLEIDLAMIDTRGAPKCTAFCNPRLAEVKSSLEVELKRN